MWFPTLGPEVVNLRLHESSDCIFCEPKILLPYANNIEPEKASWKKLRWGDFQNIWQCTILLGLIHTNPFSNENGAKLWKWLSSTLLHRKRSPKTEPFENVLQSGAILKQCFLKTLFSSVDGENDCIWKQWCHQNRRDQAPDHSTVSIQNGGQTLPCGFNFVPISRADILKCACACLFENGAKQLRFRLKTD